MKSIGWLLALAVLGGALWWFAVRARPVQRDAATGQVAEPSSPTAPSLGGRDPGSTLNNARGAANRIEDDGLKRAADIAAALSIDGLQGSTKPFDPPFCDEASTIALADLSPPA